MVLVRDDVFFDPYCLLLIGILPFMDFVRQTVYVAVVTIFASVRLYSSKEK